MKSKRKFLFLSSVALLTVVFLLHTRNPGSGYVEGWDQNTSRNIRDYLSEKSPPHIIPDDFCVKSALLLVVVHSRPDNFDARSAIRATWGHKRDNVSFFFLLGEVIDNPLLQSEVKLEGLTFGDIIQERFIDHYNNLTLKSVSMLKLFNDYCANSYKYLLKVDDDVFLNTDNVVRMLVKRPTSKNLLLGKSINDTVPFRDTSSKWFVPYELYSEQRYPNYLCGPTYVMSADVVQKLYHCALETPIFYIEDVYVTGICAKKINQTPQHDSHFTCNYSYEDVCYHRERFSLHYYTPQNIRRAYTILKNNECASRIRWRNWFFFLGINLG